MNIPDEAIEAVKSVLRDEGLDEKGGNPHSWRCEFPDLYPNHCTCVDDLARAALEAAAPLLMAQAWDEGEEAGYANAKAEDWPTFPQHSNPYRP